MKYLKNIEAKENNITINQLTHPIITSLFIRAIEREKEYNDHFNVNFHEEIGVFPNAAVPLAGVLNYYREAGLDFSFPNPPDIIKATRLLNPIDLDHEDLPQNPLNKIFIFKNDEHIYQLVTNFILELQKTDIMNKEIINSIEWSINEIMDNVLQHSNIGYGYVMGQIHKSRKHIAFTVFDSGIGIKNSFNLSGRRLNSHKQAILLAIEQGITRDPSIGQGNGLYGLKSIILNNKGRLTITSGDASFMIKGEKTNTYTHIPIISTERAFTTVDFQLDYKKSTSLRSIFTTGSYPSSDYEPENVTMLTLENEEGELVLKLKEVAPGLGTRHAGEKVRNLLLNIISQTESTIIVDMKDIEIISSSFADEVFGKLVARIGIIDFSSRIKFRNIDNLVKTLIEHSIKQRLLQNTDLL